jgi:cation diffusion facilitator CzcD-associated flavoprotein CzcO
MTCSNNNLQGSNNISRVYASRLIVATGLTSAPSIPELAGSKIFEGFQLHNKEFPKCSNLLENMQSVCVIGGPKSGWDMVYECASMGLKVNWVIRESGHGPVWCKRLISAFLMVC